MTFTSAIAHLQTQVSSLKQEASDWKASAEVESQAREQLEKELDVVRTMNIQLRAKDVKSRNEFKKLAAVAHVLKSRMIETNKGIQQVV